MFALDKRLFEIAELMMKADLFAFGGDFASLLPILNQVVDVKGLLDSKTFMGGIIFGQDAPGPDCHYRYLRRM